MEEAVFFSEDYKKLYTKLVWFAFVNKQKFNL